ncbi:MAG: helix-turn-helix domain-containing protein [Acetobacteraceae bacterium]
MTEIQPNAPAAPLLGAELARARSRLGVSLDEVGAALRIRPAYLHALEQGQIGDLPGSAYALAFLRSYAGALGLDPEAMAARFKAEATVLTRKPALEFPAPPPERGIPARAAALVAIVLAVGAYGGWYRLSGEGRLPAETVTPVPTHLVPLAERSPPPVVTPAPVAPPDTAAAATQPPTADHAPTMAYAAEPATSAVSPSSAAAATPPVASPAGNGEPHLAVRASADAWLQVRQRGGAVLFSRVLHAGETWPVPAQPDLTLTTGNAGGTVLVVDGVAGAPLGPLGAVRRDLPLDPNGLAPVAGGTPAR